MLNRNDYKGKHTPIGLKISDIEDAKKTQQEVLVCGIAAPTYSSTGILNGWRQNNIKPSFFDWQRCRFNEGIEGLRDRLIVKTQTEKPDIVFLHVQQEGVIDVETAQELAKISFVINYTFDIRSKEKTEWMHELAPHIGLTVYACEDDFLNAQRQGLKNITYCHSSCDAEVFRKLNLPESISKGVPEIVFVGNNTSKSNLQFEQAEERVMMVEFLQKEYGDRFKAYGQGWPNGSKMINNQDKINIYNSCKIAITHNQFYRSDYQSDRCWEIMACGTFAAVQSYRGINNDMIDEHDCAIWSNFRELKQIIDYFLEKENEHLRMEIAANGQKTFLERHTWASRIKQILQSVKTTA